MIEFQEVKSAGALEYERVIFKVTEPGDIGSWMILRSVQSGVEKFSSRVSDVFWFPDKAVMVGDLLVLYSKVGVQSEKKNKDGSTSHFFYWGITKPIWHLPKSVVVKAELGQWEFIALQGSQADEP